VSSWQFLLTIAFTCLNVTVLHPLSHSTVLSAFAQMVDSLLASSIENEKELERAKAECQNLSGQLAGEASTTQVHETLPKQQHGGPRRNKRKLAGGRDNAVCIVDRISAAAGDDSVVAARFDSLSTALVLARPVKGSRAIGCSGIIFASWANEIIYMRVGGQGGGGMMWIPSMNSCQRIFNLSRTTRRLHAELTVAVSVYPCLCLLHLKAIGVTPRRHCQSCVFAWECHGGELRCH
jgi:hypothetical protein